MWSGRGDAGTSNDECPVLEDACIHHFVEDDPITFLFNEPEVALGYLKDAGVTEAGRV